MDYGRMTAVLLEGLKELRHNVLGLETSQNGDVIIKSGNVGIGTTDPKSKLQISGGYLQLDLTSSAPPSTDCDDAAERGRMKVDSAANLLYICMDSGWVGK